MNNLRQWALVWQCLLLSDQSYTKNTFKKNHNSFLVKEKGDFLFFAFTGSSEVADWLSNFKFLKVSRDGMGRIHDGFADSWDELRPMVYSHLAGDKKRKIVLTGHSLGGALATLAAMWLKRDGYNVVECVTFGAPRIGNYTFREVYKSLRIPTFRFVHGYDIVPTIPRLLYFHVGELVPIFEGRILDEQMVFGINLLNRLTNKDRVLHHTLSSKDKSVNCYKNCLDDIIKRNLGTGVKSMDLNFDITDFSLTFS